MNQNTGKTHCKRGHEFTLENTILCPSGKRNCRACAKVREKEYSEKSKKTHLEVGAIFGSLTVLKRLENDPHNSRWACKCVCGREHSVTGGNLRDGSTTSCGCLRKKDAAFKRVYTDYRQNAKNRGIEFLLTETQFRSLTSSPCYYTGRTPSNTRKARGGSVYVHNGVDRLDSDKGYTIENCVPCCSDVNYAKRIMEYSDFIKLCAEVTCHVGKKIGGPDSAPWKHKFE